MCLWNVNYSTPPNDKSVKGQVYVCIVTTFVNGQLENCLSGWLSWQCRISLLIKKVCVYWDRKRQKYGLSCLQC